MPQRARQLLRRDPSEMRKDLSNSKVARTKRTRRPDGSGTVVNKAKAGERPHWVARILLADGSRTQVALPKGLSRDEAEKRADNMQRIENEEQILYAQKQRANGGPVTGETCDQWHKRMLPVRTRVKKTKDEQDQRLLWARHISPVKVGDSTFGQLPIAGITRRDVEAVRNALDAKIIAGLSASSGVNVWSVLRSAMVIACSSKGWVVDAKLHVLEENPSLGVESTEPGLERKRHWVYPSEFAKLIACESIPKERRIVYIVAAYTGLRPEELQRLRWSDVDFAGRTLSVGLAKTSAGTRPVLIEPALYELLTRLKGHPDALVCPLASQATMGKHRSAISLREDLRSAGAVDRPIFEETSTHMALGFRCLRDSYATWQSLKGTDLQVLMRRMGHATISTTLHYAKLAETVSDVGAPFPKLPLASLCDSLCD
jgi:integrase